MVKLFWTVLFWIQSCTSLVFVKRSVAFKYVVLFFQSNEQTSPLPATSSKYADMNQNSRPVHFSGIFFVKLPAIPSSPGQVSKKPILYDGDTGGAKEAFRSRDRHSHQWLSNGIFETGNDGFSYNQIFFFGGIYIGGFFSLHKHHFFFLGGCCVGN